MIKHLILNNLILVDSSEIHFAPAFNAITGETGAGKTALIEALALALGERADHNVIRKGCDRAHIEVCFDIATLGHIQRQLEQAGLTADDPEELIIRREISKEGKNRAFINCRTAPLSLLQTIGTELIDKIGQHAPQALRTSDSQRALVDLFGSLEDQLQTFQAAYTEEKQCKHHLEELQKNLLYAKRNEEIWKLQIEEIEAAALKNGEEETTFAQYQKLAHSQELAEKLAVIVSGLSEQTTAILPQLSKYIKMCDGLLSYDNTLEESAQLLHEAQIALNEAHRSLQSYSQQISYNPRLFEQLENRLNTFSKLKRKYGQTIEQIQTYHQKIKEDLLGLDNLSEMLAIAEEKLTTARQEVETQAKQLTSKRKQTAEVFQQRLTTELQSLNMSGAEVIIEVTPGQRNHFGEDNIHFWLKANPGEQAGLVKEHASGGELSRLLFAIKIALAEKNQTPTLIFDEIDANVGGKTAAMIGEKLQQLGKHRQVICITHFPQVASKADAHFSVQKIESEGRTLTRMTPLSKGGREEELLRMLGGKQPVIASSAL